MSYMTLPFHRWHFCLIAEAGSAEGGFYMPDITVLAQLEKMPNMWTVFHDDMPLLCGGTIQHWPGRYEGWAFLNKNTGRHMRYATRVAIEKLWWPKGRVEFVVRRDFDKGHRWARMIGFHVEQMPGLEVEKLPRDLVVPGQMREYGPDGEDMVAYVRHNR